MCICVIFVYSALVYLKSLTFISNFKVALLSILNNNLKAKLGLYFWAAELNGLDYNFCYVKL